MAAKLVVIDGPHHLTVLVADRDEVVERVQDRGVRKRVADFTDHVEAEEQRVLKVDYIRFVRLEKVANVRPQALVGVPSVERVKACELVVAEVLVGEALIEREEGTFVVALHGSERWT